MRRVGIANTANESGGSCTKDAIKEDCSLEDPDRSPLRERNAGERQYFEFEIDTLMVAL